MRKAGVLSILFVVVLLAVAVIAEAQPQAKILRLAGSQPVPLQPGVGKFARTAKRLG
jgi:hypothetical protein